MLVPQAKMKRCQFSNYYDKSVITGLIALKLLMCVYGIHLKI